MAHPDVKEPERVMIRNMSNGKSVVGALFRRERETPGPILQLSSDAATSLDVLAGAPVPLSVIALRREEVAASATAGVPAPDEVSETALEPAAEAPGAAVAATQGAPAASEAVQSDLPLQRTAAVSSSIARPYVQIGIFSVESNAESGAGQMRKAGMPAEVRLHSAGGKTFWRVLVGPAASTSERDRLLSRIRNQGFSDAYAVSN